jgi:flagellar biosynthesis protein FlhG
MGDAMDQAEGLRRLMSFSRARTIALVGGTRGAGATYCLINLARALSRKGRRVLLVDENRSTRNIAVSLGLRVRFDLKQVIGDHCKLDAALLRGPDGIWVLPAARAAQALPRLDDLSEQRAMDCFAQLDCAADIVLLDALSDAHEPTPFATAVQEVIIVVTPGPSSITGGYAAVKRMSRSHGRRRFHILVNRAHDENTADRVFTNMTEAATRHLDVALDFMGAIPHAPQSHARAARSAAYDAATTRRLFSVLADIVLRWSARHEDVSRLDSFMQRAIHESRLVAAGAGA